MTPARRWAEGYRRAWEALDAESVAALCSEDVVARSSPFREPDRGRAAVLEYTRRVFAEESAHEVWFGEPFGEGDRAAVEWWATFVEEERKVTLAGCTMLRFRPDGLVTVSRDYWHEKEGRRPPPEGWGS